jgi:hypothetical protein
VATPSHLPPARSPRRARRVLCPAALAAVIALAAGCDAQDDGAGTAAAGTSESAPPRTATTGTDEARTIRAGGFDWTVALFRELHPHAAPDQQIVGSRRPADGSGFWAAFLTACNAGPRPARPPAGLGLVDAFGHVFLPVGLPAGNPFAFAPGTLDPDGCLPASGTVAERVTDGVALVFEVPFDALENRPLHLRLPPPTASGDVAPARIRLDV